MQQIRFPAPGILSVRKTFKNIKHTGRTQQCSGWDWTRDLQSQRPNHYAPSHM